MTHNHCITVWKSREAKCWLAKDSDPQVVELFGTDTLPTAYTLSATAEQVIAGLQKRNPAKSIMLRKEC